jgi:DNA-binding transcriptional ArsR family regulator
MKGDADIAVPAGLLGEKARAALVLALTESEALSASELARRAGVSFPTASAHLAKLLAGRLVAVESRGRHRFYRLARPEVARAVEALAAISPPSPVRSLREATVGELIREARTCYDHLAGKLGVALTHALHRGGLIVAVDGTYRVTAKGRRRFSELGIDVAELERGRRPLVRSCLDWSERRPHVAGALPAAFTDRMLRLGWLRRLPTSRAVRLTTKGRAELGERFHLVMEETSAERGNGGN